MYKRRFSVLVERQCFLDHPNPNPNPKAQPHMAGGYLPWLLGSQKNIKCQITGK
jgi:hypothetical protein